MQTFANQNVKTNSLMVIVEVERENGVIIMYHSSIDKKGDMRAIKGRIEYKKDNKSTRNRVTHQTDHMLTEDDGLFKYKFVNDESFLAELERVDFTVKGVYTQSVSDFLYSIPSCSTARSFRFRFLEAQKHKISKLEYTQTWLRLNWFGQDSSRHIVAENP
jgi:hypothetical protein